MLRAKILNNTKLNFSILKYNLGTTRQIYDISNKNGIIAV